MRDIRSEFTFQEVGVRVEAVAEQLAGLGVSKGDVIAVMLPNCTELLITLFAAWRLRAAVTLVNPMLTDSEARYQIGDAEAVLLVGTGARRDLGPPLLMMRDLAETPAGTLPLPGTRADDLALLIYTSGSTGRPKGVMLDHANLQAMASALGRHLALGPRDHCLLVLPLFHVNAICVSFLGPVLHGAQLTIQERFDPGAFLDAVEKYRPTYFAAVPTIYARLAELPDDVRPDTSSLRFAICGAAPVSRELLQRCESRFGFVMVEGYGLTEGTCASTCNPVDGVRKLGTVGPALPGQRVATIDEEGSFLPVGAVGEVVIQSPTVMRGYWKRPEATARTLSDGWLRTGDVGHLDGDGYLTLVDRIKDMIIRGGENIYPKEIEAVLSTHPAVLETAVVGAPHPVYGEIPIAYVVLYTGESVEPAELLEHCRVDLTKIKIPTEINIVGELPKNSVGKIDKPALRGIAAAAR